MSSAVYSNAAGVVVQAPNGTVTLAGQNLALSAPTAASAPVTLASTLAVNGSATFANALSASSFTSQSGTVSGTLNVNALASSTLNISGNAVVTGTCSLNGVTGQTASFSGQTTVGSLAAGSSSLGTTSITRASVNGPFTCTALASLNGGVAVVGGASLQNVTVAGALAATGPCTFSTSTAQPMQIIGTAQTSASTELTIDRSAAGQNNVGSLRLAPGAGLQLTTNSLRGLTVSSTDQQVSVTANRSGQTFAVRGDGQISASTEILLDNTAKAAGQQGTVGVDSGGLYLGSGSVAKALVVAPTGNASFSGNLTIPGTLQASGASTFSSLNASSLSTASLTASAISTSRITGSAALALQGGDAAQTVTVTNVLTVNNIQAKPGAALALSGQDANLTTQVVGTMKVDNIGKRGANMVSIIDPLAVSSSLTCPVLTLNGNPSAPQLTITNTDSTAASDAAITLNRSAFNSAYTGAVGLRPNVGFFVQLGGTLAISTDAVTRATALAGSLSVGGQVSAAGGLAVTGSVSAGGALTCASNVSIANGLTVSGSPASIQLLSGTMPLSSLSADSNFCYLRYIDANGVIADRFKVDRSGMFTMNGQLAVGGAVQCGPLACSALSATSSTNTPSASLVGLNTTMAQVYADGTYLRLRYFDSGNALQDRILVDRAGNLAITSNLSVPGSVTTSSASLTGSLNVGGAAVLNGAVSLLGSVAITGSAPYALTLGPSPSPLASLTATSSACTLSVSDGTTLQNRLTVAQNGQVSLAALTVGGALTCAGALASGNISIASASPSVGFGGYGRLFCDTQFMHLQQWDGTNPPVDRMTISTTGLITVPNGIVTNTFAIGNDAGAALVLKNGTGTAWGSVYADATALRLRSADTNANLQERLVITQAGAVNVLGPFTSSGITSLAAITVAASSSAGAGAALNLQAGSTVSSCLYSEQGFLALQVQNSSGTLINRATLDSFGNIKLLGPTTVSGAIACTGTVAIASQTPSIQLTNGPSAPYAQLSATSGQVVLGVTNGQNGLQNGIAWDTAANMTCPGNLTVGNITTTRLTSSGALQGAASLTLTDPTNGGFGASITHTGANSTPQIVLSLADNSGAFYPQLTVASGQVSTASLSLSNALTVGGNTSMAGTLLVSGALTTTAAFRATSQVSLYADPSSGAANLYMTSSNGATTNTQIISTATYASFLQLTPGSGLTERMRFDSAQNVLFNASLIPNTTGLTIGTSTSKWNQIWSVNTPNTTSDARLKKDVEPLDRRLGLELVQALRPKAFRWKDDLFGTERHWGFIAQDVREIVDRGVAVITESETGELGMSYTDLIAPLVLAVQQLGARCAELEAVLRV
ncbi:hypothetical protein WJX74_005649 [Apatococcus lobatus]|uniref:Peptidase S74 domain-containing protein n=1 Tax=Apatococcus lobatus TaxID=904363 RepID=A0AAW1R0J9_9CHLO